MSVELLILLSLGAGVAGSIVTAWRSVVSARAKGALRRKFMAAEKTHPNEPEMQHLGDCPTETGDLPEWAQLQLLYEKMLRTSIDELSPRNRRAMNETLSSLSWEERGNFISDLLTETEETPKHI